MVQTVEQEQKQLPWTKEEFETALYAQKSQYHDLHPFHKRMNEGLLTPPEIKLWAANRFYYQKSIPLKDAAIISNCPHREIRREWIERIIDHDGREKDKGGIEAWLRLGEAVGLPRAELLDERYVLPGVRYAVDAYVNFCRTQPWIFAIASSLTELFCPNAIEVRLAALESHYQWIDPAGFEYFRVRLKKAPRDARYALNLVLDNCQTRHSQEQAVQALAFKCDLLWSQLDAIERGETRLKVMSNVET
ncbi:Pyrroloquinoline-quinone synthase [Hyella patelloides LEGE 07179]|uniref:Pyrroloquinoline-quinone synthase n=1 Tax=Hyella patelloides LEGE 07179 TaxID=945734 RepID=A0A563W275_9CYAN|nr:pyrroloquinoline-quinone synthase PqqC [Hyella patelloides]VEP17643.1 Pyrroloquinoline-quinone synthase [Hyella patelloides LEGE 07179]